MIMWDDATSDRTGEVLPALPVRVNWPGLLPGESLPPARMLTGPAIVPDPPSVGPSSTGGVA